MERLGKGVRDRGGDRGGGVGLVDRIARLFGDANDRRCRERERDVFASSCVRDAGLFGAGLVSCRVRVGD